MGILGRVGKIFRAERGAREAARMEREVDPIMRLEEVYERQVDLLRELKRGVVEVTAAKRRLQLQADDYEARLTQLEDRARDAVQAGREDLARSLLQRRQIIAGQVKLFEGQIADLDAEQQRLSSAEMRLRAKVDALKTQTEVLKAQHAAAQAGVRMGEAMTGVSEEMADVGLTLRRAHDRTIEVRSRGKAIGELLEEGVLEDPLDRRSPEEREFDRLMAEASIDDEVERLRLEAGTPPAQIEAPR
jgi:phage shock protein A